MGSTMFTVLVVVIATGEIDRDVVESGDDVVGVRVVLGMVVDDGIVVVNEDTMVDVEADITDSVVEAERVVVVDVDVVVVVDEATIGVDIVEVP